MVYQDKYSSIAQLAERMTVNHDVAGSSPAGGAIKADTYAVYQLFAFFKNLRCYGLQLFA